jgi:nucleoside 2-deoxyribosyltransferase
MSKIYLAGKITGKGNYMQVFDIGQAKYEAFGYEVFNPARSDQGIGLDRPLCEYMVKDLPAVMEADIVVLLDDDWHTSKGTLQEAFNAVWVGKKVITDLGDEELSIGVIRRRMQDYIEANPEQFLA